MENIVDYLTNYNCLDEINYDYGGTEEHIQMTASESCGKDERAELCEKVVENPCMDTATTQVLPDSQDHQDADQNGSFVRTYNITNCGTPATPDRKITNNPFEKTQAEWPVYVADVSVVSSTTKNQNAYGVAESSSLVLSTELNPTTKVDMAPNGTDRNEPCEHSASTDFPVEMIEMPDKPDACDKSALGREDEQKHTCCKTSCTMCTMDNGMNGDLSASPVGGHDCVYIPLSMVTQVEAVNVKHQSVTNSEVRNMENNEQLQSTDLKTVPLNAVGEHGEATTDLSPPAIVMSPPALKQKKKSNQKKPSSVPNGQKIDSDAEKEGGSINIHDLQGTVIFLSAENNSLRKSLGSAQKAKSELNILKSTVKIWRKEFSSMKAKVDALSQEKAILKKKMENLKAGDQQKAVELGDVRGKLNVTCAEVQRLKLILSNQNRLVEDLLRGRCMHCGAQTFLPNKEKNFVADPTKRMDNQANKVEVEGVLLPNTYGDRVNVPNVELASEPTPVPEKTSDVDAMQEGAPKLNGQVFGSDDSRDQSKIESLVMTKTQTCTGTCRSRMQPNVEPASEPTAVPEKTSDIDAMQKGEPKLNGEVFGSDDSRDHSKTESLVTTKTQTCTRTFRSRMQQAIPTGDVVFVKERKIAKSSKRPVPQHLAENTEHVKVTKCSPGHSSKRQK